MRVHERLHVCVVEHVHEHEHEHEYEREHEHVDFSLHLHIWYSMWILNCKRFSRQWGYITHFEELLTSAGAFLKSKTKLRKHYKKGLNRWRLVPNPATKLLIDSFCFRT